MAKTPGDPDIERAIAEALSRYQLLPEHKRYQYIPTSQIYVNIHQLLR